MIYCSTKAAVISVTQSLALELARDNIRVNAIAPGVIDTPMWDIVDALFAEYENKPLGQKKREVGEAVPLGRMGDPADIAGPASSSPPTRRATSPPRRSTSTAATG